MGHVPRDEMPRGAVCPWRDMKTTSSQSNLAGKYSKILGGAFRSALFTWCLGAALYWSAACAVPPNGGWQSQPESQQEQQQQPPAADDDEAAAYDEEAFSMEPRSRVRRRWHRRWHGDGGGGGAVVAAVMAAKRGYPRDQSVISAMVQAKRAARPPTTFQHCHALETQMSTDRVMMWSRRSRPTARSLTALMEVTTQARDGTSSNVLERSRSTAAELRMSCDVTLHRGRVGACVLAQPSRCLRRKNSSTDRGLDAAE